MTDHSYPCKNITATIVQNSTEIVAAVGQGGNLSVGFDVSELFGNSSVERQDEWVDAIHPVVTIAHAKFDGQVVGLLLGSTTSDKDVDGEVKTGYTQASILAAYEPVLFNVEGVFKDKDDNEYAFKCENVVFDNLTIPWGTEGFIRRNLSGSGRSVKIHYPTPS